MERQVSARAASLDRIASALERISSSLDVLAGTGLAAGHSASASDAAPAGVWRRTVTTPSVERQRSPLRLLLRRRGYEFLDAFAAQTAVRQPRPWLGMVGPALAGTAALVVGDWWLMPPLAACAWWWCPREWPFTWLVPVMCAPVGAAWVAIGRALFTTLPVPLAGLAWASLPAFLAAVGAWFRTVGAGSEARA